VLIPDAVVGDHRGEEYAAEEGQGVLVVAGGDAAHRHENAQCMVSGFAGQILVIRSCPPYRPCGRGIGHLREFIEERSGGAIALRSTRSSILGVT
jgi:hypothetical protein